MRFRGQLALASALLACVIAMPAEAGIVPYVRLDYGSNQLQMHEGNNLIEQAEASFKAQGLPAEFRKVGAGLGPSGSVGLWLFPGFRIGATYSYLRSVRTNHLHVPGQLFYADDLDFRMTEVGGEAAVRFTRLLGFTLGANVAKGRSQLIEGYSAEDASGQLYQDATANGSKTTYGAFLGFDQTNPSGVAGFIRAGFQYRNMGSLPSQLVISDGTTTTQATGNTIPLDYGGFYLKLGIGYDLGH